MIRFGRVLIALCAAVSLPAQAIINTVAGNGSPGTGGDGGPATSAQLGDGFNSSLYVATDAVGNFYITDVGNNRLRKVNAAGIISSIANPCFCQGGAVVDAAGNLYIASGSQIRKGPAGGTLSVIAGGIGPGFSGDGGPAAAALMLPTGVVLDAAANIYVADTINNRIRKIDAATGIINTIAGNGTTGFSGDGGPAVQAALSLPQGMAIDASGNIFFADGGSRIRKFDAATGRISTVAGNGSPIGIGENVPAVSTGLATVSVAVDSSGNLYYTDIGRVRKVNAAGMVTTIAGVLPSGFSGDGGPATEARFSTPNGVAVDPAGNIYVVDQVNKRIRRITASGATAPSISAGPARVQFSAAAGASPAAQTVAIGSTGPSFSFTAAVSQQTGGSWLSVAASGPATPATLTLTVNSAALSPGTYSANVLITASGAANSPFSIPVALTVAAAASGTPFIESGGIVNASGYQRKLAPGTVFVVFGRSLGPGALAGASAPVYPASLAGTSVSFTPAAGGAPVDARIVYTSAGQVAALLPSSITPGVYAVRVTYDGQTSPPETVTVVARSFGIATVNSAGSGPAQVTIGNVNGGVSLVRFTSGSTSFSGFNWTLTPAHGGDTLVLWGTGGGADTANDSGGTSGDQTAAGSFAVLVGGRRITPLYAGASQGYPGLWQINFTLPPGIQPDCYASLQVAAGSELSNLASIAIAPEGAAACVDPDTPPSVLSKLDNGGTITGAVFAVERSVTLPPGNALEFASGGVFRWTAAQWITGTPLRGRLGQCSVYDRVIPRNGIDAAGPDTYLDAGSRIPIQGPGIPAGGALTPTPTANGPTYSLLSGVTLTPGAAYTITGPGGADVGAFGASATHPATFNVTNLASINAINRTEPLTITWTGSGVDRVHMVLTSVIPATGGNRSVTMICISDAAPGTFTIPAASLASLLPAPATSGISVNGQGAVSMFNATLTAGGQIDFGSFAGGISYSKTVTVR